MIGFAWRSLPYSSNLQFYITKRKLSQYLPRSPHRLASRPQYHHYGIDLSDSLALCLLKKREFLLHKTDMFPSIKWSAGWLLLLLFGYMLLPKNASSDDLFPLATKRIPACLCFHLQDSYKAGLRSF